MKKKISAAILQKKLLSWFDHFGRKELPWQQNKSAYPVWVSEIMLQQTQVSTVMGFFQRFMNYFPNLATLADAAEDEVLHVWTGLGYYQRARNLHKTAKIIIANYQGKFPDTVDELVKLPGIGQSTAGAISAIAFAKKAAILDGNVKRVLVRLHGITQWPGEKKTTIKLWELAEKYTPLQRVADYTQAIMDLGATVCVRGKPHCLACPLKAYCFAYHQGTTKILPTAKPRKTLPVRSTTFLILRQGDFILLEKRSPQGVWAHLWSLPQLAEKPTLKEIKIFCRERFNLQSHSIERGPLFRHTFSHFHLDISPVFVEVKSIKNKTMEAGLQIWYNLTQPQPVGMPAPVKSLLEAL